MGLFLRAVDLAGPLKWRWLLTDEKTGTQLADHAVDLDSAEVARFAGLYEYERWNAAPDQPIAGGTRLAAAAGEWARRELHRRVGRPGDRGRCGGRAGHGPRDRPGRRRDVAVAAESHAC